MYSNEYMSTGVSNNCLLVIRAFVLVIVRIVGVNIDGTDNVFEDTTFVLLPHRVDLKLG